MRFLLCVFFILIPFQWALGLSVGVDLAVIRVLSLGVVLLWVGRGLSLRRFHLPVTLPSFFLSAFLLWALCSFIWAENSFFAGRKILFFLSFLPLFFVFSAWFEEYAEDKWLFLQCFVWGAFFSALSGIFIFLLQFIFGVERVFSFITQSLLPFFLGAAFGQAVSSYPSLLVNISGETVLRASGFFPDPHMFSLYLGMALPFAGVFIFTEPARKRLWLFVFLTLLLADFLSFSRGGYVALVAGGAVMLFATRSFWQQTIKQRLFLVGVLAVISALFLVSPVGTRFFSSFSQTDGSHQERVRLWQEAIIHITARPLLGTGLGNYPLLVKPSASYREPIYAHNLYLDTAAELGLVGLMFLLSLIGLVVIRSWRGWKKSKNWLALALVCSLTVFLIHSLFETPLYSVHILPVLMLLLASGVSYKHEDSLA